MYGIIYIKIIKLEIIPLKIEEAEFKGVNNTKIFYKKWIPNSPRAVLQIIHGFGEHCDRYKNVVNKLVPEGYVIYANDHRGHGRSGGTRTYIDSFDQYIEDEKLFFDLIKESHPNLPLFLLGHSMGSFIAIHFVKKYQSFLKGVILSGTGGLPDGFLRVLATISLPALRVMSILTPKMRIPVSLGSMISSDPEVGTKYNSDPLVVKTITIKLANEMIQAVKDVKRAIPKFRIPILIQVGSDDMISRGISVIKSRLRVKDQTIRIYPGLRHEVYNEMENKRSIVLQELKQWLNDHI